MNNLYSHIKESLQKRHKNIILMPNKHYSSADIDGFSARISFLLTKLGVAPGDRLAAKIEKSEYSVFLYLACLRAGIIYLPLNNTYAPEELDYFFADARPKIIVCDPADENKICAIKSAHNILIKTLADDGSGSLLSDLPEINSCVDAIYPAKPDDTAVIIYTSGTTGKSKGAMITHRGILANTRDLNHVWGINEHDVLLHMLPLFHVHGLFFALNTVLLAGGSIIFLPKFDVDLFFQNLSQATVFSGVPTYYMRLLSDDRLTKENCKHMRLFISGSAPLLPATFDEFRKKTGHKILERYGLTETGINTSNLLTDERKAGVVGKALPNVNIRVVDHNNKEVLPGEAGHVQIKGDNLFKGYWMKPEKTREDFTDDGYFKTGDLGILDSDGYLSIVGRYKDMIITGGLNVYPKEIESTIDMIDGVVESAIIGVKHDDFGEAVVAVVVGDKTKLNEQMIIDITKKHHAGYKCPKAVFFVDQLPKNAMGKVQKNVLREKVTNDSTVTWPPAY